MEAPGNDDYARQDLDCNLIQQEMSAALCRLVGQNNISSVFFLKAFYSFSEFISQYKHKYNNMSEEYWPNGQHRVQPLTCG